jgi:TRAP transporter TAXI family solute receptor
MGHVKRLRFQSLVWVALGAIAALAVACGSDDPTATPTSPPPAAATPTAMAMPEVELPGSIKIATGSVGGSFFVWGSALAQVMEREFGIPVSAEPTAGTDENIRLLDSGEYNMIGVTMNRTFAAFRGDPPYEKAFDNMRAVASLYPSPLFFITRTDSGIDTLQDFVGKRIGWGTSRGYDLFIGPILEVHGVDWENDIERIYAGFGDMHTQLQDGTLDAILTFVSGGLLSSATKQLATLRDIKPIPYDPDAVAKLPAILPYMNPVVVSEEVMSGLSDGDFLGVNSGVATIVVDQSMDDAVVSEIARVIYENLEELATIAPQWNSPLQDTSLLSLDPGIPMHPGAVSYWEKVGLR